MNLLLLFFALPVATIIIAIVIEKILRNPFLTAAFIFAIYLIITFALFDATFLVFAIVYTILAFIAAVLAEIFFCRCGEERKCCKWWCCRQRENNTISLSDQDVARIANQLENIQRENNNNCCNHQNNTNNCNCMQDIATVNVTNNTTGGRTSWCCCRR